MTRNPYIPPEVTISSHITSHLISPHLLPLHYSLPLSPLHSTPPKPPSPTPSPLHSNPPSTSPSTYHFCVHFCCRRNDFSSVATPKMAPAEFRNPSPSPSSFRSFAIENRACVAYRAKALLGVCVDFGGKWPSRCRAWWMLGGGWMRGRVGM